MRNPSLTIACAFGIFSICALPAEAVEPAGTPPPPAQTNQPIDLPTVLRLAGANNLDLAIVRQQLLQAKAADEAATLRFFPWLAPGFSYDAHNGAISALPGPITPVTSQIYGPQLSVADNVDLGDAIYQKLSTKQLFLAADNRVEAQRNDTLLAAANAYFDLVSAVAQLAIARDAVQISSDYDNQLQRAVGIGVAQRADELQVSIQTQRYEIAARQAEELIRLKAAALAVILHIDPAINLLPVDQIPTELTLIPPDADVSILIAEALDARPELHEQAAVTKSADYERKGAIYGPLVPSLGTQLTYGGLGGGPNGSMIGLRSYEDFAFMLNWRIGPGGLFDFSRIDDANARLEQARLGLLKLHDQVTGQVVQSYETTRSAKDQIDIAEKSVDQAQQSVQLYTQRRQFGVGAVLEVITAQQDLTQARTDLVRARTFYAEGEYALAHAIARIDGMQ
jgi:outer membrane protein TolC